MAAWAGWLGRRLGRAAGYAARAARAPWAFASVPSSSRQEGQAKLLRARVTYRKKRVATNSPAAGDVIGALSSSDARTRIAAVEALGLVSKERAEHLLAGALHDPDSRVREAATQVAAELRASSAVFSLILGLDDADRTVRAACSEAIETITGREVGLGPEDLDERHQWLGDLRAWWKEERFAHLVSRGVELSGSHEG